MLKNLDKVFNKNNKKRLTKKLIYNLNILFRKKKLAKLSTIDNS